MLAAYVRLHELGLAHSVEAWQDGRLAGGMYGVKIGRAFFGESMFHLAPDASKAAFAGFALDFYDQGGHFIDCQQATPHMLRFGARPLPRREFLERLRTAIAAPG
jgi:leucyl/phenylalanyl-tRNA--protein transferase